MPSMEKVKATVHKLADKALPPEARTRQEIFTVLNAVTLGRAAVEWSLSEALNEDPGRYLKYFVAVKAADKESWLAKLGDLPEVGETFRRLGFRRSEFGRRLDAVVDKMVGARTVKNGVNSGIIPSRLGYLSLAQKAVTSGITIYGEATLGDDMSVSPLGQIGEAITDAGLLAFYAAETVKSPTQRNVARAGAGMLTATGVCIAAAASVGYANDAEILYTPGINDRLNAINDKIQQLVPFL